MRLIGRIFGTRVRFVAAEEMDSALDDPEVVLLDVRTAAELEETGTIPGALHIHLGELAQRIQEVPKDRSILTT